MISSLISDYCTIVEDSAVGFLISVILLGAIISDIDSLRSKRREQLLRAEHLTKTFDREAMETMLDELDADGGGVSKYEFVVGSAPRPAARTSAITSHRTL